jgi:hypothetical protein
MITKIISILKIVISNKIDLILNFLLSITNIRKNNFVKIINGEINKLNNLRIKDL